LSIVVYHHQEQHHDCHHYSPENASTWKDRTEGAHPHGSGSTITMHSFGTNEENKARVQQLADAGSCGKWPALKCCQCLITINKTTN